MDCIFCKIAAGEIPAQLVYQDEEVVAFRDLHPVAPQHILIIPRKHIATLNDLTEGDTGLAGQMTQAARLIAAEQGFAAAGYRVVMNCNADAGQSVFHIHMHLLAGRSLGWPPG